MTERDDGVWDPPTEHDDRHDADADMSGEDPPTMRATEQQRARAARGAAIAEQLASTTAPRPTATPPRPNPTPAHPGATPPRPPVAPNLTLPPPTPQRSPAKPAPRAASSSTAPPTIVNGPAGAAPAPVPAGKTSFDDPSVLLLDRVSGNAPTDHSPRRTEAAAGGIVVVATGTEADRVRTLCHKAGLLVPVMASLAVVHDAMSVVVIGEPSPPAPERVVHVARPNLPDERLIDLLRALASGRAVVEPPKSPASIEPKVAEAARRLTNLSDRGAIEMVTIEAITALTAADRAHCLFYEPLTGALWSESRLRARGGDDRRAMGGLVGWAAQTGQTVHASPAGDDPRWLQELDDPEGKPQSRLLVQPIIGADRRVHAVLVAVRRWRHADFADAEKRALATFAALAGPALDLAVAASPAPAFRTDGSRAPRATLPGTVAAAKSALVTPPRAASDSRPPPLTARTSTQPPPASDEKATVRDVPRPATDDRPTKVETIDPRIAADAGDEKPTRTEKVDPRILAETRGDSDEFAGRSSDSILPLPLPPNPPTAQMAVPKTAATMAVSESGIWQAESGKWPSPAGAPAAKASATSPSDTFQPNQPARRPPTGPVDINKPIGAIDKRTAPVRTRPAHDSNHPRSHRDGEARDVAVVASGEDAKRVQKLAKKARLELSIVGAIEEAPAFFQVVTVGGAWSRTTENRVAYAARPTIGDEQLVDLLLALSTGHAIVPAPLVTRPQSAAEARRSLLAFSGARKLGQLADLVAAETTAIATLKELLDCDRAYCLLHDPDSGALWSPTRKRIAADDRRAIAGVTGWAAHTGRAVAVSRASADPRWLGPIDDPEGDENSQLLVQPLLRADDRVYGVLVAARRAKRPGFTDTDAALLARFAALAGPPLEHLEVALATQQMVPEDTAAKGALALRSDPLWLEILRGQHAWSRWAYLAIGALLAGLLALIF